MEKIELPKISILTPTFNRRSFAPLAIKNIMDTIYPKDKMEWLICDDSNDGTTWDDLLFENKKYLPVYHYYRREKKGTIGYKRNYLCKKADNSIMVFMDDDDIYFPHNIINRVRPLINNTKICLVGSKDQLLYFGHDNTFRWKIHPEQSAIHEGTMAFRKVFWKKRNFLDDAIKGEGIEFLKEREDKTMHIPCSEIMFMCCHGENTIEKDIFFHYLKEWKIDYIPPNLVQRIDHYNSLF